MSDTVLALSLTDQYQKNKAILGQPISSLAKMAGLRVDDVYDKLLPELAGRDFSEVMRYAEVGLRYATVVDRNRLREECGEKFITAMSMIIGTVKHGLNSNDHWIKRKAMVMHGDLIDEMREKQRFIETLMTEKKLRILAQSNENIDKLEQEILDMEMGEDKTYGVIE